MAGGTIQARTCSKWYGHVLGISDITLDVTAGIVGLLGPNGAGKSTLMKLMAGLLRPSRGDITVLGETPFASRDVRAKIGYCPEHEGLYDELTALEFVTSMAELSGIPRKSGQSRKAAEHALAQMGLTDAQHRRVRGFSKGMRQRTKLAQTLVHDPEVLLLDEPMTGIDPVARAEIGERIRDLGKAGKTIVMSSHVLYEIESLTRSIVVIYRGQVLAEGDMYEIRTLIDKHPHRIKVECDRPRVLGHGLAAADHVVTLEFDRNTVVVETADPDRCYDLIAEVVLSETISVRSLTSPDNNLGAVFQYLTGGRGA